jgi:hypothetical protein
MAKRGPKVYHPDWKTVDNLCKIQCIGEEIASVLEISYDTLERACKREKNVKFADYIKEKSYGGKAALRRSQWKSANEKLNPTMLVWLGKNMLGQTDKNEDDKTSDVENLINALSALSGKLPV